MIWKDEKTGKYKIRYFKTGSKKTGPRVQETLGDISYDEALTTYKIRLAEGVQGRGRPTKAKLTFKDLAEEYVSLQVPHLNERNERLLRAKLKKIILPEIGHIPMELFRPSDVEKLRQKRLASRVSKATVNRDWILIRAILNKAEALGLIERNPIPRGALKAYQEERTKLVYFEPHEWRAFLGALDDDQKWITHARSIRNLGPVIVNPGSGTERRHGGGRIPDSEASFAYRDRLKAALTVFEALLYTGCRRDEILSLKWADVDLRTGNLHIWQGKTGRRKTIPISDSFRRLLPEKVKGLPEALVFPNPSGKKWDGQKIHQAFAIIKKLSGIRKELRIHDLRHTHASWLAIAGVPLKTIQELLGHTSITTTMRYAHLSKSHLKQAVDIVGDMARQDPETKSGATIVPLRPSA